MELKRKESGQQMQNRKRKVMASLGIFIFALRVGLGGGDVGLGHSPLAEPIGWQMK